MNLNTTRTFLGAYHFYVTVETVPHSPTLITKHFIQHMLDDRTVLKLKKRTEGFFRSKNSAHIREKQKDSEYGRKENERRKLQRRGQRASAKNGKLVCMPNRSIVSETNRKVSNKTQNDLKKYVVPKKFETIQVTTSIHQLIEKLDTEKLRQYHFIAVTRVV